MSSNNTIDDCVLLPELTLNALATNLKARHTQAKPYTKIGNVIISVNPHQEIPGLYDDHQIEYYREKGLYEVPPHIYAIADEAYRSMRDRNQDQCVLITGESGSGKTEASKIFMKYIAKVTGNSIHVQKVTDRLLLANPVLESFGNASTRLNGNSSRFGKYTELEFNFKAQPVGGKITTYLLEKARVTQYPTGERSFHVFYQLLQAPVQLRDKLYLKSDWESYVYLASGEPIVQNVDDAIQFQKLVDCLDALTMSKEIQEKVFRIISGILHLGNIEFVVGTEPENANNIDPVTPIDPPAIVSDASRSAINYASEMLGLDVQSLEYALTHRTIKDTAAKGKDMVVPLTIIKANQCRNACARAIYSRLFNWIVEWINSQISSGEQTLKPRVIGVLDIFGFEIFNENGFDQFCINFANEKLQQLFVEQTLGGEQAEYAAEGIPWEYVSFFDNKKIVELIEAKQMSVLALLDEETQMVGDVSDLTYLSKLNKHLSSHRHFDSREKSRSDKTLNHDSFRIDHYAGKVTYHVKGFLERNTDSASADIKQALSQSTVCILNSTFNTTNVSNFKRSETLSMQFRSSLNALVTNMLAKAPHYIRCIKPNQTKVPDAFDEQLVIHQATYLGLMENIQCVRSGYCFRERFDLFLRRYKMLCPKTWPEWTGDVKEGITQIFNEFKINETEYKFGLTKLFIASPLTLHQLEEKRNAIKERLATKIQATWRMSIKRRGYLKKRSQIIRVQTLVKSWVYRSRFTRAKKSATTISKIYRGYYARKRIARLKRSTIPKYAVAYLQKWWRHKTNLVYLHASLEEYKHFQLSKSPWYTYVAPKSPWNPTLAASLTRLNKCSCAMAYLRSHSQPTLEHLKWKLTAFTLLAGKEGYSSTIGNPFKSEYFKCSQSMTDQIRKTDPSFKMRFVMKAFKIRRNSFKESERVVVLTTNHLWLFNLDQSVKAQIPILHISCISLSPLSDGLVVLHCDPDKEPKGDLLLSMDEYSIPFVSMVWSTIKESLGKKLEVNLASKFTLTAHKKRFTITFEHMSSLTGDREKHGKSVQSLKPAETVKTVPNNTPKFSLRKNRSTLQVFIT